MDTIPDPVQMLGEANDTGRHHLYRVHTDCAAAAFMRGQIASAMRGIPLDPGQHRAEHRRVYLMRTLHGHEYRVNAEVLS